MAPRLATLESKTIGLIDNRKRYSDVSLDHLQTLMRVKYGVADFRYYLKCVATPEEIMDSIIADCDAETLAVAV